MEQEDMEIFKEWIKVAGRADLVEEFMRQI